LRQKTKVFWFFSSERNVLRALRTLGLGGPVLGRTYYNGTTASDGTCDSCGTIFNVAVTRSGFSYGVSYSFVLGGGVNPYTGLTGDAAGNL
jgi:hypothetical protein